MSAESGVFRTITEEVKEKIADKEVVFPSHYSVIFADIASEHRVELGSEAVMNSEMIEDRVMAHTIQLSESADKAVNAIATKNETILKEVLAETQALRDEIAQLKSSVYEDALTKVFNRKWLQDHYFNEDSSEFTTDGILVIIDMNDFKYINDTYGHISGDKVLAFIAAQLKRTGGNVVRYGGDEFFVLFDSELGEKGVSQKMHILRETVIKKQVKVSNNVFKTSFSYGASSFSAGEAVASVIDRADATMYSDKEKIKSRLSK